jgi:hypothetical protein
MCLSIRPLTLSGLRPSSCTYPAKPVEHAVLRIVDDEGDDELCVVDVPIVAAVATVDSIVAAVSVTNTVVGSTTIASAVSSSNSHTFSSRTIVKLGGAFGCAAIAVATTVAMRTASSSAMESFSFTVTTRTLSVWSPVSACRVSRFFA